jgi:lipid-binding SYLF domain-containing protein
MDFSAPNPSGFTYRLPHVPSLTVIVTLLGNELPAFCDIRRFTYGVQKSLALGPVPSNTMQSKMSHTTNV